MSKKIYLYTPWCEQGLSYDAKVIEEIAIKNNYNPIITFDKKRKIKWPCKFVKTNKISSIINKEDVFFCFERIPHKYIKNISNFTQNIYLMINYEYYEKNLYEEYKLFKTVFCKSKEAHSNCINDGIKKALYMPWILWNLLFVI